jgi:3-oxoacyl-[acyl-carrier protein] reductase
VTVLVTGGSRGIGRAVVEALLAERAEATVAFTFRSSEAEARQLEQASGGRARGFRFDLADRGRPDELVEEIEDAAAAGAGLGPIDGLVNNAGVLHTSLLAMTPDADWDAVLDADLGGAFRCCRAVLRGMVHRRRGSIVNLASLAALHGVAGQGAYAAAKGGLVALTRSLAREVGRRGILVNAVVPGFVATEMTAAVPAERVAALRAGECLPGGVGPAAVAAAVVFLLSEGASAITGQTLVVDAGASA